MTTAIFVIVLVSFILILLSFIFTAALVYQWKGMKEKFDEVDYKLLGTNNRINVVTLNRNWGKEGEEKHTRYKGIIFAIERSHINTLYTTDWKSDLKAVHSETKEIKKLFLEELSKVDGNKILGFKEVEEND